VSCETQGEPNDRYDELSIEEWVKSVPFDLAIGLESAEMFALMEDPGHGGGDPSVVPLQYVSIESCLERV
jgi:hypothetical protein